MGRKTPGVFPAYGPENVLQLLQMLRLLRLQESQKYIGIQPAPPFEIDPFIFQSRSRPRKYREQGIAQLWNGKALEPAALLPDFTNILFQILGQCQLLPISVRLILPGIKAEIRRPHTLYDVQKLLVIHMLPPFPSAAH
ncbi:hypothetical protein D3C72_1889480 [compost metagenome]